jgi:hypothetical protein
MLCRWERSQAPAEHFAELRGRLGVTGAPPCRLTRPFRCSPRARTARDWLAIFLVISTCSTRRLDRSAIGANSTALEKAAGALKGLQEELGQSAPPLASAPAPSLDGKNAARPIPVEVRTPEPKPLEILQSVAGTLLPPLATAGIVILVFPRRSAAAAACRGLRARLDHGAFDRWPLAHL